MFFRSSLFHFSRNSSNLVHLSSHAVKIKPKASEVLTGYLRQTHEPPWTSYFVKHKDVINDQYGMSHFNWQVGQSNYTVLRVGCFPFIKYHCTKGPKRDLDFEDKFYRFIKVANFGIPCFMYGIAALFLIKHKEIVYLDNCQEEDWNACLGREAKLKMSSGPNHNALYIIKRL